MTAFECHSSCVLTNLIVLSNSRSSSGKKPRGRRDKRRARKHWARRDKQRTRRREEGRAAGKEQRARSLKRGEAGWDERQARNHGQRTTGKAGQAGRGASGRGAAGRLRSKQGGVSGARQGKRGNSQAGRLPKKLKLICLYLSCYSCRLKDFFKNIQLDCLPVRHWGLIGALS